MDAAVVRSVSPSVLSLEDRVGYVSINSVELVDAVSTRVEHCQIMHVLKNNSNIAANGLVLFPEVFI